MSPAIIDDSEYDGIVDRIAVPVEQSRLESMYLPIIVEKALIKICVTNKRVTNNVVGSDNTSLIDEVSVYLTFLNKIALVCDSERGSGKTINSVVIRQDPEGPVFMLAFNRLTAVEAQNIAAFLSSLLSLIGQNPEGLNIKPLQKRVLWRILQRHVARVDHYLTGLVGSIDECIDRCLGQGGTDGEHVIQELRALKSRAEFPRDVITSDSHRDKFLSDCEKLIKAIATVKNTALDKTIQGKANQAQATPQSCWHELRHFMGRLYSYRQATEVITGAVSRWPDLFINPDIRIIPSSQPDTPPLANVTLCPAEVVQEVLGRNDLGQFQDELARFKSMGLDKKVWKALRDGKHRPIVHCEVLLHSALIDSGFIRESDFFNNWKVMGTSKPLCRLCHYYFTNHPDKIRVRGQHPNLYPCWRLPDVYEDQGPDAIQARDTMVKCITQAVTQDAFKTLYLKFAGYKRHDSNTSTYIPGGRDFDSDSDSDSSLETPASGTDTMGGVRDSKVLHVECDSDSDFDGGVIVDREWKGRK